MNDFTDKIIAETIDWLVAHYTEQPDLDALARRAGYDPSHFQKLFREKVGISPKRLVQYMSLTHARDLLLQGVPTLEAAYGAGLSGNGRLHDLFVTIEAATPGEVQKRGQGLEIVYGFHPTPLGAMLVAQTARGVCYLGFLVDAERTRPLERMRAHFPRAAFNEDSSATAENAASILRIWQRQGDAKRRIILDLHGTNLQLQVWQALLKIPTGATVSYKDIATQLGRPSASRAVGNAVGANPVSLLIPCHRVIQATGIVNNYGWGSPRKKMILGLEGMTNETSLPLLKSA